MKTWQKLLLVKNNADELFKMFRDERFVKKSKKLSFTIRKRNLPYLPSMNTKSPPASTRAKYTTGEKETACRSTRHRGVEGARAYADGNYESWPCSEIHTLWWWPANKNRQKYDGQDTWIPPQTRRHNLSWGRIHCNFGLHVQNTVYPKSVFFQMFSLNSK